MKTNVQSIKSVKEGDCLEKCQCYCLPPEGRFTVGSIYPWSYVIDGLYAIDDNGQKIFFDEIKFLWYFKKID